jgi:hypothetical protein
MIRTGDNEGVSPSRIGSVSTVVVTMRPAANHGGLHGRSRRKGEAGEREEHRNHDAAYNFLHAGQEPGANTLKHTSRPHVTCLTGISQRAT